MSSKSGTAPSSTTTEPAEAIVVTPPNIQYIEIPIIGTAPSCVNKFSQKAMLQIRESQEAGSTAKTKRKEAKNFHELYEQARHIALEGWDGIAASAFRSGAISACRLVKFTMTMAKLSIFFEPDGIDRDEGTPLVRIIGPTPEMWVAPVRNDSGVIDLRARPLFRAWGAALRIKFDADQFTLKDVANLIARVGAQVGVGEGRPDSKDSHGLGFGLFRPAASGELELLERQAA